MKSNFIVASLFVVTALASVSSFAEGDFYGRDPVAPSSSKTRAEVRAELSQAQSNGYQVTFRHYLPEVAGQAGSGTVQASFGNNSQSLPNTTATNGKTRAEVRAELALAQREGYQVTFKHYLPAQGLQASTATRAEVKSEFLASRANGTLALGSAPRVTE